MPAVKRSVAFDPEVWKEAEAAAREEGTSLSVVMVNDALSEHLALREGLRAMEQWQADHGAFTEEELALAAVEALDAAVASGVTPTRGAAVQRAVREWLASHGEEAITASYRHRYKTLDPDQGLIASLGEYSLKACLAASED